MKHLIPALVISVLLISAALSHTYHYPLNAESIALSPAFILSDDEAPNIILLSPENESIVKPFSWIDIDVTDDVNISHVLYHWDLQANETLESPYDLMARTSEVDHFLYVYANDTSNNWASAVFMFTSDWTSPNIDLLAPENESIYQSSEIINVTATDLHLDSVMYSWDSNANVTWNPPYVTNLITGDGMHTFDVYANDSAGNWAKQEYAFITDDLKPNISLASVINGSLIRGGTDVAVLVQDASLDTILYSWDGTSSNLTAYQSPLITQVPNEETTHILRVYANDTFDRWNSARFAFEVDNTPPTIQLVSPMNDSLVHSGVIITLAVNETSGVVFLFYSWDGQNNESWLDPIPSGDGLHTLDVYAYDQAGNIGYARYTFEVDDSSPIVDHPEDLIVELNQASVNVTWQLFDSNPYNYVIYRNGSIIDTRSWISGEKIIVHIDTNQIGVLNYTIVITDTLGNAASDTVIVQIVEPNDTDIIIFLEFFVGTILAITTFALIGTAIIMHRRKNLLLNSKKE